MKRLIKKGFTLVELVVVIAIIAILSGVGVAVYIGITNKAKASADSQVITQLNLKLKAEKGGLEGANDNCFEAYLDAEAIGFNLNLMKPQTSGAQYVWDQEADLFCVVKDGTLVAGDKDYSLPTSGNEYKLWKFVDTVSATETYSQYLTSTNKVDTVNVIAGFDCGKNEKVVEVNYSNSTTNIKNVIIRTNSDATTLNITDNSDSKIIHFGDCGIVNSKVGMHSLYIEEDVGFLEIKEQGHIVVNGSVEFVYTSITDASKVLVEGNVEHAHATNKDVADSFNAKEGVHWDYKEDGSEKHPEGWSVEEEKYEVAPEATENNLSKSYVCHINGTGYETVKTALLNCNNKTIVMLNDSAESSLTLAAGLSTTINLNGHSFTSTSDKSFNQYNAANIIFVGEGTVECFRIGIGASITFDDTFTGRVNKIVYYSGSLVIKGGFYSKTITIDDGASYKPNTYKLGKFVPTTHTQLDYSATDVKVVAINEELSVASVTIKGAVTYFDSLQNAFDFAKNGGTVALTKDINGGTISNYYPTAPVTFDLNGHTWDLKNGITNETNGIRLYQNTLTVKTSLEGGKIIPSYSGCNIFDIRGGTLIIENGEYYNEDRGGSTASGCYGNLVINGGTLGKISTNKDCETVEINGGTFYDGLLTAYNSTTVVDIKGGTFLKQVCCNQSMTGVFNISGGTFNTYIGNGGTFNISGGLFTLNPDIGTILATDSNTAFTLTGGTYEEDVTKNSRVTIPTGYHWDAATKSVVKD